MAHLLFQNDFYLLIFGVLIGTLGRQKKKKKRLWSGNKNVCARTYFYDLLEFFLRFPLATLLFPIAKCSQIPATIVFKEIFFIVGEDIKQCV